MPSSPCWADGATPPRSGDPQVASLRCAKTLGATNALDKLAGALARMAGTTADGIVVLTRRESVERVQKAVTMGVPIIVAMSAPTAPAVRTADAGGITRVAIARADGFAVFAHGWRIAGAPLEINVPTSNQCASFEA
jgi:FdhD protein